MTSSENLARALRCLLLPVLVGVGAALAGMFVVRDLVSQDFLRKSGDVVGNYLQTLGTIYAVLLAFVVFVVWSQFNDARQRVEAEANELLDLARTARGFAGHTCSRFHAHLAEYLRIVTGDEWRAMGRGEEAGFDAGWAQIEEIWNYLMRINPDPEHDREQALYAEMLSRFDDLSDSRSVRLSSATIRIPLGLRLLLYFGATTMVASMYLFAVESWVIHALLVAALAGSISHVLYIIDDLDHCFVGQWQVPRTPFERVSRYLVNHPGSASEAVAGAERR